MDSTAIIFVSCLVIGLIVGFLAGMFGIGGGLIIVPALTYLLMSVIGLPLELAMPMAIATSLSAIIFTGYSSARAHYKLGNLKRNIVIWSGVGISFGAILGAQVASSISGALLKNVFAVMMILIALQMIFGKRSTSSHQASRLTLSYIGAGSGFFSALMGIGGGVLLVPALTWFQVNMRQAIGCASFCGLVVAVFGTMSFIVAGLGSPDLPSFTLGYVYLPATFGIVATSIFTAGVGARVGQKVDTELLKKLLAGLLILVSIRMIVGMN
ncbi:sulfite exporter TauE/SafE family protein [Alteromonas sp. ASW11-130]|uniref:sulfite exporter TauE/SafE family protein n=1 Tax=Alteromonas sp. ASW11-130 TaxID=3015775 RepID=UPI002241B555|nr:sulfite exporter TauE/SafE family protein [Alteromonas sp. ASW11-130]MCW8091853.1 sulfite exporter TauE/SafE family protein [Alteromonas sp. ASW11-130]